MCRRFMAFQDNAILSRNSICLWSSRCILQPMMHQMFLLIGGAQNWVPTSEVTKTHMYIRRNMLLKTHLHFPPTASLIFKYILDYLKA